jgi:LuxR family transcriptional regulator, maltose regulon positive regulatory protein
LFVVPLDDERQWYRYHQLFGELLRSRLRQTQRDSLADMHRRASEWWEEHGYVAEAVGHAIDAGDVERAAKLVESNALTMMDHGQLRPLVGWLDALPDTVVRARPWLCVYHALAQMYIGRELAVEPRLLDAERAMQEAGAVDRAVEGYIATIRAYAATIQGDMQAAGEMARRALDLLPADRPMARGMAAEQLSVALYWTGDLQGAEKSLKLALEVSRTAGNNHVALLALCHLAALRTERGQLRLAAETFREAAQMAESVPGPAYRSVPIAGFARIRSARVYREWNELQAAQRLASEGIVQCEQWGWADGLVFGYTDWSQVLHAAGDVDGALEALWKAKQVAEGSRFLIDNVAALEAELWLALGDQLIAEQWAAEQALAPDDPIPFHRGHTYQVYARLLLAQGRAADAIQVLERLQRLAEQCGARFAEIEGLVLLAVAWASEPVRAPDKMDLSQHALARALDLGEPERFVRVFVDEGQAMSELLQGLLRKDPGNHYAEELLALLRREAAQSSALQRIREGSLGRPEGQPLLIERLSEREREVLRLLATHLATPEMAENLIVSTHTVRSHIKSIYGKLDVHSRLEAVDRARELGLI